MKKGSHASSTPLPFFAAMPVQIHGVESFVGHVNSALRQRHEQERLREILSRIESYEAIEAKDEEVEKMVRSHCDLDLTRPMHLCSEHQRRHLLIEGDLKLRDQASSKMDVHCFLFTDVLLICKLVTRKVSLIIQLTSKFEKQQIVRANY
jgi:pleckstrin homology domain-containing family G member 5